MTHRETPIELTVVLPAAGGRHLVLRVLTDEEVSPVESSVTSSAEMAHGEHMCTACSHVLESEDQADLCRIKRLPPLCARCYRARIAPKGSRSGPKTDSEAGDG